MEFLWLIVFVAFLVLEAVTTQFICIWFAGGSLFAFICSLFNLSTSLQIWVFIIASALLLVFTRKIVHKLKSNSDTKTNIDALIGETAVVTEDISNIDAKGSVKVCGNSWSARSADGNPIEKDSYVTVKEIEGVKLIVDKISN